MTINDASSTEECCMEWKAWLRRQEPDNHVNWSTERVVYQSDPSDGATTNRLINESIKLSLNTNPLGFTHVASE